MQAPTSDAVKTYRYLRLAIVVLAVLLAAAVVIEWFAVGPGCWETSLSAYVHTPARSMFIASVLAAGVCMIVVKGSSELEDVLLNTAGMLAGVVAVVPVAGPSTCRPAPLDVGAGVPAVENGIGALLVAAVLSLGIAAATAASTAHRIGLAVGAGLVAGAAGWFLLGRASFVAHAHYVAAGAMFACIVVVVLANARGLDVARGVTGRMPGTRNRYTVLAVAMPVVGGGLALVGGLTGQAHTVLWVETVLLLLFAAFWIVQTHELWDEGQRPRRRAPAV